MTKKKTICSVLSTIVLWIGLSLNPMVTQAAWDGGGAGSGNTPTDGLPSSYMINNWNSHSCVIGYRFSGVTASGKRPNDGKSIDVISDGRYNKVISLYHRAIVRSSKHEIQSKVEYAAAYRSGGSVNFRLTKGNRNRLISTSTLINTYGAATQLPDIGGDSGGNIARVLKAWQANKSNIDAVAKLVGFTDGTAAMNKGDLILIEPLYDLVLDNKFTVATVSEYSQIGAHLYGSSCNGWPAGVTGKGTNTWGYIRNYTNGFFPNQLYAEKEYPYWDLAKRITINSAGKPRPTATFGEMLSKGYGVGICYEEKTVKNRVVRFALNSKGGVIGPNNQGFYRPADNYWVRKDPTFGPQSGGLYWQSFAYPGPYDSLYNYGTMNLTKPGYHHSGYFVTSYGRRIHEDENIQNILPELKDYRTGLTIASQDKVDVDLQAEWIPNDYNLTVNPNGGLWDGSTSIRKFKIPYQETKNIPLPAKSGYRFTGWKIEGSGTLSGTTYTQGLGDCTLKATWEKAKSVVFSVNANGGQIGNNSEGFTLPENTEWVHKVPSFGPDTTFKYFQGFAYPGESDSLYNYSTMNLTKPGYHHSGYFVTSYGRRIHQDTNLQDILPELKDSRTGASLSDVSIIYVDLYAEWIPNTYYLSVDPNGGIWNSSSYVQRFSMPYQSTRTIQSPSRNGYIFTGWTVIGSGTLSGKTYTQGMGNCTIKANWKKAEEHLTLTVNPNGGEWLYGGTKYIAPHHFIMDKGSYFIVPKPTKAGSVFMGWKVIGSGSFTGNTFTQGYGHSTIIAQWNDTKKGYLRFIETPYLHTLEIHSPWRQSTWLNQLKTTLEAPVTKDTSVQVWHFSKADYAEIHEWCISHPKGPSTNRNFLTKFGSHRIK